jgi:hypothetical protein
MKNICACLIKVYQGRKRAASRGIISLKQLFNNGIHLNDKNTVEEVMRSKK